jgi:PIN domain nuclease of toxin-antitoxin system
MEDAQVILLDTHVAIWFITDDAALGPRSKAAALGALAQDQLAISAISFWEIALLVSKGRMRTLGSAAEVREQALEVGAIELPLTGDIALRAVELGNLPGDPGDRFIMATAIVHNAILMTADTQLLTWKHPVKRQHAEK